MAARFPSQEWADAAKAAINGSQAYREAAKTWEGDFYFIVEETGEIIYMDLWHGECREATYTTDAGYREPAFTISAKRDTWRKVLEGKLDPIQGLMTRQLKLRGNLIQIMKNVKAAQELVKAVATVPAEF